MYLPYCPTHGTGRCIGLGVSGGRCVGVRGARGVDPPRRGAIPSRAHRREPWGWRVTPLSLVSAAGGPRPSRREGAPFYAAARALRRLPLPRGFGRAGVACVPAMAGPGRPARPAEAATPRTVEPRWRFTAGTVSLARVPWVRK